MRSPLASKTTARHRVSLVGGQSRRRFDYHTVAPDAIEKTMPPVASDLLETKLPQQGAARAVLGKHPADQLMHPAVALASMNAANTALPAPRQR